MTTDRATRRGKGRVGARAPAAAGLAAAGLLLLLLALAPPAGAHALLRDSTPADGEILDAAPAEVVMEFTEPPDLGLSDVSVVDGQGNEADAGELRRADEPGIVAVDLPELEDGVYTVSWRVLSRVDGHVTAGAFAFGVGHVAHGGIEAADAAGGAGELLSDRPSALSVGARWGLYWGLTLLMGGALSGLFVFRRPIRAARLLAALGWGLGAAALVALLFAEADRAGVSAGALLGSDRGGVVIARAVPLLLAGIVAVPAVTRAGRLWPGLLGAATALGMLIHAYAGHASGGQTFAWARVGIQWVHILAAGVWIGGLAWLLAGLVRDPPEERGPAVRRFSFVALFALAGVAITGGLRAWDDVGSIGALVDTGFGLSALGKSVLFAGLLGLGAYNRYRLVPRVEEGPPPSRLRRTVSAELLLAAGVFGLTGVMAGLAPPAEVAEIARGHAEHEEGAPIVAEGSDFATTARIRLEAVPGTAGPNRFSLHLRDYNTDEPLDADQVVLRFSLPERADVSASELAMTEEETGHWTAEGTNLSVDGTWRIGVRIERGAESVEITLELATRQPEQDIQVIEGGPGQPTLYTIGLPGGRSAQAYVDPGEPGANQVHVTFFSTEGGEEPVDHAEVEAVPNGHEARTLIPRMLSEGHLVASADLEPGTWRFRFEAMTEDGTSLAAEFEQEI